MKQPRYVIGIDGGGTKTAAIIADARGDILAQHVAGPSNFQIIGVEKAAQTIYSLIRECCSSANVRPAAVSAMTIGLTGAGRTADQQRMADSLTKLAASKKVKLKRVQIESDARIALEGAFKGASGIILIAGTGSIAFGKDASGHVHRVGGWGRVLGDEGSGYFIGRHALTAVCRDLDKRSSPTILTKKVAKRFSLKTPTDIITAVYKDNFDISTLAPLVMEAVEERDPAAEEILRLACSELVEHVRALIPKVEPPGADGVKNKIPLSFIGGLIGTDTPLSRMLRRQISESIAYINVIAPMSPPVYGAVVMAMSNQRVR